MNRAGYFRENLSGEMAYQSFVPSPLPPKLDLTQDIFGLIIKASNALAVLESLAKRIPNMGLFVSMYVRKEALMSSQIEGTQATLEDVLDPERTKNANRDVGDVVNYIRATDYAFERLKTLPLCNRLLKETHAILMEGVRGEEKCPGEFRRSQNWIGARGCNLKTARYVPPSVSDMQEAMSALEAYWNSTDDEWDDLIRAALIHYQFETIHPFLDGNGRVGRLLISLFLKERKILTTPALYISYYLKRHRVEYYDRMSEVRQSGDYEQWIRFFLKAIIATAEDAVQTIDTLVALHDRNSALLAAHASKSKAVLELFAHLEANPIVNIRQTAAALHLSYNTTASAVRALVDLGILVETTQQSRNRVFAYEAYLQILRPGT